MPNKWEFEIGDCVTCGDIKGEIIDRRYLEHGEAYKLKLFTIPDWHKKDTLEYYNFNHSLKKL